MPRERAVPAALNISRRTTFEVEFNVYPSKEYLGLSVRNLPRSLKQRDFNIEQETKSITKVALVLNLSLDTFCQ